MLCQQVSADRRDLLFVACADLRTAKAVLYGSIDNLINL